MFHNLLKKIGTNQENQTETLFIYNFDVSKQFFSFSFTIVIKIISTNQKQLKIQYLIRLRNSQLSIHKIAINSLF